MRFAAAVIAVALTALVAASCAAPARPVFTDADYPGVLRAPALLGTDVLWRQRVVATWREGGADGGRRGFDAAVQKQGDELVIASLSPMGGVGFSIVMRGASLEVQNHTGEELPFPPRFIVLDVQRAFWPWIDGEPAPRDGERAAVVDGERITETYREGRLVERRFSRVDGEPAGEIVIRHEWADADRIGPTRTVMDNGWFGYRLVVDTVEETRLSP